LTFHPSCFNCLAVRVTLPPSSACDVFSICISVIDNTYCSQSDPERGFVTQLMQFIHNEMADTNNRINWLSIRQPEGVACPSDWLAPLNYLENKKSVNYTNSLSVWIDYQNWKIAQVKILIEPNVWSWSIICQDIFCWICDRVLHRGKGTVKAARLTLLCAFLNLGYWFVGHVVFFFIYFLQMLLFFIFCEKIPKRYSRFPPLKLARNLEWPTCRDFLSSQHSPITWQGTISVKFYYDLISFFFSPFRHTNIGYENLPIMGKCQNQSTTIPAMCLSSINSRPLL
jgi:hypothetical protein